MDIDSNECSTLPNISSSIDREFILRNRGSWNAESEEAVKNADLGTILAQKRRLKELNSELQHWKERVHDLCIDDESKRLWRLHTQKTHPLHFAPKQLRDRFSCESTSQAFCKFLEILTRFPRLIKSSGPTFRTFHLCEAPGHFVGALDRFLCTYHSNLNWHWEANSLNPHNEFTFACDMLLDDDLIVAHPSRWRFGLDDSGDITRWDGEYYRTIVGDGFDLVTADGSIYVQDAPGEQEKMVLPLMQAEVNAALRLLRNDGCLVLKMYSMFLPETRKLVADVASRFKDVSLFKPMCSKSGNSERYIVCKGFSSKEPINSQILTGALFVKCEEFFSKLQGLAIKSNLESFNSVSKDKLNKYKDRLLAVFFRKILAKYVCNPFRTTWLEQVNNDNPWKSMIGNNYVERLRDISSLEPARAFINGELQSEVLGNGDDFRESQEVEVEWAKNELQFLHQSDAELLIDFAEVNRILVYGPSHSAVKHSLFTEPTFLHAANQIDPKLVIDLCSGSDTQLSNYCRQLCNAMSNTNEGIVTVDISNMGGKRDWLHLLRTLLECLQDLKGLVLICPEKSYPMILSRFSASVVTFLTILFSKFHLKDGDSIGLFKLPNYEEDLPPGMMNYLREVLARSALVYQFVPLHLLATMHSELVRFNRRQWSYIFPILTQSNV